MDGGLKGERVHLHRAAGTRRIAGTAVAIAVAFGLSTAVAPSAAAQPVTARPAVSPDLHPGRTPLANPVITAMLVQGHPTEVAERMEGPKPKPGAGKPANDLARVVLQGPDVTLSGEQSAYLRESPAGPVRTVRAATATDDGGTQVTFADRETSTFVPGPSAANATPFPAGTHWSQVPGPEVAERDTIQLSARAKSAQGTLLARYWIDTKTHAVLWQQTYAANGTPLGSVGFTSIDQLEPAEASPEPAR